MSPQRVFLALCIFLLRSLTFAAEPKLIVLIDLDQFRYDYMTRFKPWFGKGGFNFLINNGANFTNASYKHSINVTGPAHAVMVSGCYGNTHGIISNDWYDRDGHRNMYCVDDTSTAIIGASGVGKSPRNFIGSTLGDELRLKTGFQAKVISISNKDRAAILMGGKLANGVFWMAGSVFVTSTYYMKELPDWVQKFNQSKLLDSFFGKRWTKVLPEKAYASCDVDDAPYERNENNMGRTFPHRITGKDTTKISPSYYSALWSSPYLAQSLATLVKQGIAAEQLGQRGVTDMLCISFSSTDGVGHAFGPYSHEVMDMAVQMDAVLADLFSHLDRTLGLKNCVFVLTADHGVAPIPEYILAHNPRADVGRIPHAAIVESAGAFLNRRFGEPADGKKWIDKIVSNNVYFNYSTFASMKVPSIQFAAHVLADSLRTMHAIAAAYSAADLNTARSTASIQQKMAHSFFETRSGDVMYALRPFWVEGDKPEGANHGEPYEYDAHVPLIIVAKGIRKGSYAGIASPADIAPTLASLLGIEFPAANEGRILTEAFTASH